MTEAFTSKKNQKLKFEPTSAQRFGLNPDGSINLQPKEWVKKGPTSMRLVNYTVDEHTECYLTFLKGDAGGALANLNRWRKQLELEEVKDIPENNIQFAGAPALKVELTGTFSGKKNYGINGLIQKRFGGLVFIKMTGPMSSINSNRATFDKFFKSFTEEGLDGVIKNDDNKTEQYRNLDWDIPEEWLLGKTKPMRNVTFVCGETRRTEAYITVLGGDGGGALDNVNRWRKQLGLAEVKDLNDCEKVDVLQRESLYVKISGQFKGMNNEKVEDAMIIGVICDLRFQTLFIKMVGPKEEVLAEEKTFKKFLSSIHYRAEKKK